MEHVNQHKNQIDKKSPEASGLQSAEEKQKYINHVTIQRRRESQEPAVEGISSGPEAFAAIINKSSRVAKGAEMQDMANQSPVVQKAAQQQETITQSTLVASQRRRQEELFGAMIDGRRGEGPVVQRREEKAGTKELESPPSTGKNNTGMPDTLKSNVESLSGISLDDVKVHYNSDKPAQLQAHAFAQGSDIHIGTGQERHLPHEAWHVVQQKQGRVKPTAQMKGMDVNDAKHLEQEADNMGQHAVQLKAPERQKITTAPDAGAVVQRVPVRQADGTFIDPLIPGYTLILHSIEDPFIIYQITETGGLIAYNEKEDTYHVHDGSEWVLKLKEEVTGATGADKHNDTGKKAASQSPLDRGGNIPQFFPSIGSFLNNTLLQRLYRVLGIYGPQIVKETLQAKEMVKLRLIGLEIHKYVRAKWEDTDFQKRLKAEKPALFWKDKVNVPAAGNLLNDYLGTIGEFFDEARVKQRIDAKGETSWVLTHEGGAGETGIDMVIIKCLRGESGNTYVINCHEDKLSTAKDGGNYAYGKEKKDYDKKDQSSKKPSGMPEVYRSNYDKSGAMKNEPEKLHHYHNNPVSIYQYLIEFVNQSSDLPEGVRKEVLALLGQKSIDIRWKFTAFGKSNMSEDFGVPFSKITDRGNASAEPMAAWLNDMESDKRIERHFKIILEQSAEDLKLLEGYKADSEELLKSTLARILTSVQSWRSDPASLNMSGEEFLEHVRKELEAQINDTPESEQGPGPVKKLALKYLRLISKDTSRKNLSARRTNGKKNFFYSKSPTTVKAGAEDLNAFTLNYNNPDMEGVYQGPSLAQNGNHCGQYAAFNALQLANKKDAGQLKNALLDKSEFHTTAGPLQADIDDLQVREILDRNGGEQIPVLNMDTIEMILALMESMEGNLDDRDALISNMLNPMEYLALWQFYKQETSELVMVLQTGAEGSNAIDHFIAVKLVRSNGKVSLLFLDSLSSGAYKSRLEYLARLLSVPDSNGKDEENLQGLITPTGEDAPENADLTPDALVRLLTVPDSNEEEEEEKFQELPAFQGFSTGMDIPDNDEWKKSSPDEEERKSTGQKEDSGKRKLEKESDVSGHDPASEEDSSAKRIRPIKEIQKKEIDDLIAEIEEGGLELGNPDKALYYKLMQIYSLYFNVDKAYDHIVDDCTSVYYILEDLYEITSFDDKIKDLVNELYAENFCMDDAAEQTAYEVANRVGQMKEATYVRELIHEKLEALGEDVDDNEEFIKYVEEIYLANGDKEDAIEATIEEVCGDVMRQAEADKGKQKEKKAIAH